jgi:hypothetical protein|tara:strand:- start:6820 stop:7122 length:303 start_codon:yes stop_codon:yes gene_type:complete
MKIAQFPMVRPAVVAGQRNGGHAADTSRGRPDVQGQQDFSRSTAVDRSQRLADTLAAALSGRGRIPARLLNEKAIETYNINSSYSLFGGEGELIGVDLHA